MSKHHCYPKSRFPMWKNKEWNIVTVTQKQHNAYNILFGSDATPLEAIITILECWTPEQKIGEVITELLRYFHHRRE